MEEICGTRIMKCDSLFTYCTKVRLVSTIYPQEILNLSLHHNLLVSILNCNHSIPVQISMITLAPCDNKCYTLTNLSHMLTSTTWFFSSYQMIKTYYNYGCSVLIFNFSINYITTSTICCRLICKLTTTGQELLATGLSNIL